MIFNNEFYFNFLQLAYETLEPELELSLKGKRKM